MSNFDEVVAGVLAQKADQARQKETSEVEAATRMAALQALASKITRETIDILFSELIISDLARKNGLVIVHSKSGKNQYIGFSHYFSIVYDKTPKYGLLVADNSSVSSGVVNIVITQLYDHDVVAVPLDQFGQYYGEAQVLRKAVKPGDYYFDRNVFEPVLGALDLDRSTKTYVAALRKTLINRIIDGFGLPP